MHFFKTVFNLIKDLVSRYFDHEVGQSGGQIAYFSLLSFFPFIIYMNTVLTVINVSGRKLITFISSLLPPEITSFLDMYIADIANVHTSSIVSLSIITTVYSANRVMRSFETALNKAYGTDDKRGVIHGFLTSVLFTVCLAITGIAVIILTVASENVLMYLLSSHKVSANIITYLMIFKWVITLLIMFLSVSSFYYYMPIKKVSYKSVIPGTITTILGISIFSLIFNGYIKFAAGFSVIYSSIGAVFLLIFWLYFAGVILVMGAEINNALEKITPLKK